MVSRIFDALLTSLGGGIVFVSVAGVGLAITDTPYPPDAQLAFAVMGMVVFGGLVSHRLWRNAAVKAGKIR